MIESDKRAFKELMDGLTEYYLARSPKLECLSTIALQLYFGCLNQYSIEQITSVASRHVADIDAGRFYPVVADFIKHLEGGEITEDMIIAAAKNPQTPLGCLARITIGSWDLSSADSYYLRQRAAECKFSLPEWREKAKAGSFTDHEISVMLKYNVNPSAPLHNGLAPPIVNMDLIDTAKRIESSPRHLRFIEPSYVHDSREIELTKEMAEVLDQLKNKKGGDDE